MPQLISQNVFTSLRNKYEMKSDASPFKVNGCDCNNPETLSAVTFPSAKTICPDTFSRLYGEFSGASILMSLQCKFACNCMSRKNSFVKELNVSVLPLLEKPPTMCPPSLYPSISVRYGISAMVKSTVPFTPYCGASKLDTESEL